MVLFELLWGLELFRTDAARQPSFLGGTGSGPRGVLGN